MKQTLIFCYLAFFVIVLLPFVPSGYPKPDSPLWLVIPGILSFGFVAISIFLYGVSYKPKPLVWFWKVVPVMLIIYLAISWYWEFILYREPDDSTSQTAMATIFGLAVLFPAIYLSFKFAYSKFISPDKVDFKFNPKSITIIFFITALCVASHFIPGTPGKIKINVDYVAKLNEISKPANYDPNDNAGPYYQKAFELCVERPEQIGKSDIKTWPKDLPEDKQLLLQNWVSANSKALEQLELGTQKPYYWLEYQGSSMWDIAMPSFKKTKSLTSALCSQTKFNAAEGNFEAAFSNLLVCYRFGMHLTGPKVSIEQLAGIGISANAVLNGFEILDKTKPDSDLLKNFQLQLELLSDRQSCVIDLTAEKFLVYDSIQRMFTDDGKGGGHVYNASPLIPKEDRPDWEKMDRRETDKLAREVFEYLDFAAHQTPNWLHKEGKDPEKVAEEMTKENPFLYTLAPAIAKTLRTFARIKVHTDALITTIALLRYKSEKNRLPESLDQLVENGYLKGLPVDPFSDNPLVYKQIGDDFILYSFGADFDDDGGTPSKWGEGEQGGDQVFWPVSRKQE